MNLSDLLNTHERLRAPRRKATHLAALTILSKLQAAHVPVTTDRIETWTDLSPASVKRILLALRQLGLVQRTGTRKWEST